MENSLQKEIKVPGYLKFGKVVSILLYIWVIFGVIVLGLRVFLLAFSANAATPFVQYIYKTSADYLAPFRGIFPSKPVGETGYLDVASIFAIIMYLLFAWLVSAGINYIQAKIDLIKEKESERKKKVEELEELELLKQNRQNNHSKNINANNSTK
jgi:uncharacterized protein YggT (Ycf19 family)